jgi:hypothetical protein
MIAPISEKRCTHPCPNAHGVTNLEKGILSVKISISLRRGVTADRGLGLSARDTTFDRICATQHYLVPEAKASGSRPRDLLCASVAH